MSKKQNSVVEFVTNETTKVVNGKVSANVDLVENSALSFDNEECESPKKQAVFASVRKLFGFSDFDRETAASELQIEWVSGKITFKELTSKLAQLSKEVNKENEKIENISFDDICNTLSNSSLISDFSLFVGGSDLLSLRSRLLTKDNKVILYHGKQSEDSEKFETIKITKKGLHKPYSDVTFVSYVDYSTSNVIRAFRCYGYYLASEKRVNRQVNNESKKASLLGEMAKGMHDDLGFMPKDFVTIIASSLGMTVSDFLAKCK